MTASIKKALNGLNYKIIGETGDKYEVQHVTREGKDIPHAGTRLMSKKDFEGGK